MASSGIFVRILCAIQDALELSCRPRGVSQASTSCIRVSSLCIVQGIGTAVQLALLFCGTPVSISQTTALAGIVGSLWVDKWVILLCAIQDALELSCRPRGVSQASTSCIRVSSLCIVQGIGTAVQLALLFCGTPVSISQTTALAGIVGSLWVDKWVILLCAIQDALELSCRPRGVSQASTSCIRVSSLCIVQGIGTAVQLALLFCGTPVSISQTTALAGIVGSLWVDKWVILLCAIQDALELSCRPRGVSQASTSCIRVSSLCIVQGIGTAVQLALLFCGTPVSISQTTALAGIVGSLWVDKWVILLCAIQDALELSCRPRGVSQASTSCIRVSSLCIVQGIGTAVQLALLFCGTPVSISQTNTLAVWMSCSCVP
jgi:energy-converting hydrogenase Eha subunit G